MRIEVIPQLMSLANIILELIRRHLNRKQTNKKCNPENDAAIDAIKKILQSNCYTYLHKRPALPPL